MELFARPLNQRIIASSSIAILVIAGLSFFALIGNDAGKLAHVQSATTVHGWLNMYELYKGPAAAGGYEASIRFLMPGIGAFVGLVLAVTVLVIFTRIALNHGLKTKCPNT